MHCTTNACTVKLMLAKQVQMKNFCTVRSVVYRIFQKITWAQYQFRILVSYSPRLSGMMRGWLAYHSAVLLALPAATDSWINTESYLCICEFCLSDLKCDTNPGTTLKPNCPLHKGPTVIQFYLAKIPTCKIYCNKTQASVTGNRFSHYEEASTKVVSQ